MAFHAKRRIIKGLEISIFCADFSQDELYISSHDVVSIVEAIIGEVQMAETEGEYTSKCANCMETGSSILMLRGVVQQV